MLLSALHASAQELGLICPASQGGEAAWAGRIEVLDRADIDIIHVPTPPHSRGIRTNPDHLQRRSAECCSEETAVREGGEAQ